VAFQPALLRHRPALAGRLAHRAFLAGPTPVEPLALPELPPGRLFVKRDERSSPLYGGNKPRKLEFVIGACLRAGARRLVTTGGLGTHHGLATAILGREAGLATTLVLVDQPVSDEVRESLLLFTAWGAEVVHGRNVAGAALGCVQSLALGWLRGERPRLVPTGGSGSVGNLGFVSAAFELAEQVQAGVLPEPTSIFVPVGTGGTQAGLVLGLRLAGLASRVIGVLVTDILPPTPARLARSARATLRRLRGADPDLPEIRLEAADFELTAAQLGPGYGAATPAAREAAAVAAASGLHLETTYGAKCLAELSARAARGELPGGPVLFWNTFNAVDVKARAPHPADPRRLPASLQRLFRPDVAAGRSPA
jgi:D-cysteine desulfhydrase